MEFSSNAFFIIGALSVILEPRLSKADSSSEEFGVFDFMSFFPAGLRPVPRYRMAPLAQGKVNRMSYCKPCVCEQLSLPDFDQDADIVGNVPDVHENPVVYRRAGPAGTHSPAPQKPQPPAPSPASERIHTDSSHGPKPSNEPRTTPQAGRASLPAPMPSALAHGRSVGYGLVHKNDYPYPNENALPHRSFYDAKASYY